MKHIDAADQPPRSDDDEVLIEKSRKGATGRKVKKVQKTQ